MIPSELRGAIQQLLADNGFNPGPIDKDFGPKTFAALNALDLAIDPDEEIPEGWHRVKATLFADPEDVKRFKRCKAEGHSDNYCFQFGDNGIGKWEDDTTVDSPYCALPPDDWNLFPEPQRGTPIKVWNQVTGTSITCKLMDTMPAKKNIKNGAGIDLNKCAFDALGLKNGEGKVLWALAT
jgi:hypothetical protein